MALILSGCGFVPGAGSPRQDDPNAVRPDQPTGAVAWEAVAWQDVLVERSSATSIEQSDRAQAVAAGPDGFVAVGSNGVALASDGRIWQSPDALDWRLISDPLLDGIELEDVAATSARYVAVGTRSSSPNHPVASIFVSTDGSSWEQAELIDDSWAGSVAAGAEGFAVVLQADESSDVLFSSDGSEWKRVSGGDLGPGALVADIAWDGAWVAVGAVGNRAALWRSEDGTTWVDEPLPGSQPVDGVIDVSAYRVIPGQWATIVLGLERGTSCAEDDDFCSKYQVAWSYTAAGGWVRLPKSTWILDRGYGIDIYGAGTAGFVYLTGPDLRLSPDGWSWEVVREIGGTDGLTSDLVVVGDRIVAVGVPGGPDLSGWFGTGTISR